MLNLNKLRKKAIAQAISPLASYGISPPVLDTIAMFLDEQEGRTLYRANPRVLATHLHLPERNMLQILVAGVKEGIFTLNWEIQCPFCGGIDPHAHSLSDLRRLHTCPACHQTHDTDADDQVRVTFSVDDRIRKLEPNADDPTFRLEMDRQYGVVSGHHMLTLQTFRDLFPRETLPPSESLLIRRVAILFTDLAGSTALYTRHGDTRAYDLVRKHFDLLFDIVDRHHGVVVKTIGDAIMGAFMEPVDALRAAIAMHRQLDTLNQDLSLPPDDYLILKAGIDLGPCISVTLNNRLDYFGTTVNTAARVQSTSTGNTIAITETLIADEAVREELKPYPVQRQIVLLKGLDTPVVIHYIFPKLDALQ